MWCDARESASDDEPGVGCGVAEPSDEATRTGAKIAAAREELGRYIEAFVNGTLQFGNPVSDHLAASPDATKHP